MWYPSRPVIWPVPQLKRLKRKFILQLTGLGPIQCPVATVVAGERASRSIVNRTTALWSIWMVASLIVAGLGIKPVITKGKVAESLFRRYNGALI